MNTNKKLAQLFYQKNLIKEISYAKEKMHYLENDKNKNLYHYIQSIRSRVSFYALTLIFDDVKELKSTIDHQK
jgi:hypothetical protein